MIIFRLMVGIAVVAFLFGYLIKVKFLAPRNRRKFELFVAKEWESKGFKVKVGRGTKDNGIDLVAIGNGKKYIISCKRYKGSVGRPYVQQLYGVAMANGGVGVIATTGRLTKDAVVFCKRVGILINQY